MDLKTEYIKFGVISGIVEHTFSFLPRNILDFIQTNRNIELKEYLQNIMKERKYLRFTNGYLPMISSVGFAHIPLFYFYEKNKYTENVYYNFIYGSLGKGFHDVIMCPGDTIRMHCNLMNINSYKSFRIILKKGPNFFFKGLPTSLFMSIPGGGLEFLIINRLNRINYKNNYIFNFLPGFLGGFTTSILLTPIDYLKTQMQIQGSELNKYKTYKSNIKSHIILLKEYYKNVGLRGIFRGGFISGFNASICYGTYEIFSIIYKLD